MFRSAAVDAVGTLVEQLGLTVAFTSNPGSSTHYRLRNQRGGIQLLLGLRTVPR